MSHWHYQFYQLNIYHLSIYYGKTQFIPTKILPIFSILLLMIKNWQYIYLNKVSKILNVTYILVIFIIFDEKWFTCRTCFFLCQVFETAPCIEFQKWPHLKKKKKMTTIEKIKNKRERKKENLGNLQPHPPFWSDGVWPLCGGRPTLFVFLISFPFFFFFFFRKMGAFRHFQSFSLEKTKIINRVDTLKIW